MVFNDCRLGFCESRLGFGLTKESGCGDEGIFDGFILVDGLHARGFFAFFVVRVR